MSSTVIIIILVVVAILITTCILAFLALKTLRKRHDNPRYIPTAFLKGRWRRWSPGSSPGKGSYSDRLQDGVEGPTLHLRPTSSIAQTADVERDAQTGETTAGVDRNTSVRSVMTLPAYSRSVRENERVLGREGERAGIDVLLEAPETTEEQESQREEEMESLYQIRLQRRREIADREARRTERRTARARGDSVTLNRLREEAEVRREQRNVLNTAAMIADHRALTARDRRTSEALYPDVGVVRHDGTRIRSGSTDSDNRPLLDSAASLSGVRPWVSGDSLSVHRRDRSGSSAMSAVSGSEWSDNELDPPPFGRAGGDFEVVSLQNGRHSRAGSQARPGSSRSRSRSHSAVRPSISTSDLGEAQIPLHSPPGYNDAGFEDAPPYTSPVQQRRPESQLLPKPAAPSITSSGGPPLLPEIGRLPSIRIAAATPIEPRRVEFPPVVQE